MLEDNQSYYSPYMLGPLSSPHRPLSLTYHVVTRGGEFCPNGGGRTWGSRGSISSGLRGSVFPSCVWYILSFVFIRLISLQKLGTKRVINYHFLKKWPQMSASLIVGDAECFSTRTPQVKNCRWVTWGGHWQVHTHPTETYTVTE